jgi:hypothetical protein
MLTALHGRRKLQLFLGLLAGIIFGFLLQKGGVTKYEVIIGQLLLVDFTVVRVMLSAVVVGMLGIHVMKSMNLVNLHPKPDSISAGITGGLIFGIGFATMGYCPGTLVGAVGNGNLDAIAGGLGVILGAGLFASVYGRLQRNVLRIEQPKNLTLPELFGVNRWTVVIPAMALIVLLLWWLDGKGFRGP